MSLSRDDWKKRLKDAELDPDIVETFINNLSDDQLVRMKEADLTTVKDAVVGAVSSALLKCFGDPPEPVKKESDVADDEDEDEDDDDKKPAASMKDLMDFANYIIEQTVTKVKDMLENQEIEVDVPILTDLQEEMGTLKEAFVAQGEQFKELLQTDTQRLKDTYDGMSSASKARLQRHFSTDAFSAVERAAQFRKERDDAAAAQTPGANGDGVIIKDSEGRTYASASEFAAGTPVPEQGA